MVFLMLVNLPAEIIFTYEIHTDESGYTAVNLLCTKTKIAPLNKVNLPRLNAIICLILFWGWIRTSPHILKTVIASRVSEI